MHGTRLPRAAHVHAHTRRIYAHPYRWRLKSVQYDVEHVADVSELRPPAAWEGWGAEGQVGESRWSERPPPEVLFLNGTLRIVLDEEKSAGRSKRKGDDKKPEGCPNAKANNFAVGTRRKGVDGKMWEVTHQGSKGGDASGLVEIWRPLSKPEPAWMIEEKAKARKEKAKKGGKGAVVDVEEGQGDDDEDDDDDDDDGTRRKEFNMVPVMENELRLAGISAKKGYEELVYAPPPSKPQPYEPNPTPHPHPRPRPHANHGHNDDPGTRQQSRCSARASSVGTPPLCRPTSSPTSGCGASRSALAARARSSCSLCRASM